MNTNIGISFSAFLFALLIGFVIISIRFLLIRRSAGLKSLGNIDRRRLGAVKSAILKSGPLTLDDADLVDYLKAENKTLLNSIVPYVLILGSALEFTSAFTENYNREFLPFALGVVLLFVALWRFFEFYKVKNFYFDPKAK